LGLIYLRLGDRGVAARLLAEAAKSGDERIRSEAFAALRLIGLGQE